MPTPLASRPGEIGEIGEMDKAGLGRWRVHSALLDCERLSDGCWAWAWAWAVHAAGWVRSGTASGEAAPTAAQGAEEVATPAGGGVPSSLVRLISTCISRSRLISTCTPLAFGAGEGGAGSAAHWGCAKSGVTEEVTEEEAEEVAKAEAEAKAEAAGVQADEVEAEGGGDGRVAGEKVAVECVEQCGLVAVPGVGPAADGLAGGVAAGAAVATVVVCVGGVVCGANVASRATSGGETNAARGGCAPMSSEGENGAWYEAPRVCMRPEASVS